MRKIALWVGLALSLSCGKSTHPAGVDGGGHADLSGTNGADLSGTNGADLSSSSGVDSGGPPAATCTPPFGAAPTTNATVVGHGSAGDCTEAAFSAAAAMGGAITFNCGTAPVTITLHQQVTLPIDKDTVIDGGNLITLDGGGATRLLYFNSPNFLATMTTVTLQHLTLQNAKVAGTMPIATINPNPNNCSQGFYDGAGGAIFMRDGVLHVVDCIFSNNQAEQLGPDVGGGAIYTEGSLDTTVVGSRFINNSGSNSGAIGSLFGHFASYNNLYMGNHATGHGQNGDPGVTDNCPCIPPAAAAKNDGCMSGQYQTGSGGNAGAVGIDGGDSPQMPTFTVTFCGDTFSGNVSGALGGAMARTPDNNQQKTIIMQSTLDGNTAHDSGAAFYFHNSLLEIDDSTISNHTGPAATMQADGSVLNLTNVTIAGNHADTVGGALGDYGNTGTWTNVTMANNTAGQFAAGIQVGGNLTFKNVLIDNNISPGLPMACNNKNMDGGHNIQFPQKQAGGSADTPCTDNITFLDPMLGMLADNGGPTLTLLPASAALQVGAGCPDHDQRQHPRSNQQKCTVGAVELP